MNLEQHLAHSEAYEYINETKYILISFLAFDVCLALCLWLVWYLGR